LSIKGEGWKALLEFRDSWDEFLAGMEREPTDDVLETMFRDKIKDNRCISHDYENYIRAEKGSPMKSYQFLYDAVDSYLSRKLKELNRAQIRKENTEGRKGDTRNDRGRSRERPATPAPTKTKKKKGDGKGKDRNRTPPRKDPRTRRDSHSPGKGNPKRGVCYLWKNRGKCEKHDKGECPYKHEEKDKGTNSRSSSPKDRKGRGDSKGRKGSGKGDRSLSKGRDRKSIPCHFFLRGKCLRNEKCEFKHDESDLQEYNNKKGNKRDFQ
jgi:hypothetical protein